MYIIKEPDGSETWTGERLKYYYEEHRDYWVEYAMDLNKDQTRRILKKLERHFKIRVWIEWHHGTGGRYCGGRIMLNKVTSMGILCHEISHAIHHQKYHKHGHTKMLKRIMARVVAYCKKHEYWQKQEPSSIFDFLDNEWGVVAHAVE